MLPDKPAPLSEASVTNSAAVGAFLHSPCMWTSLSSAADIVSFLHQTETGWDLGHCLHLDTPLLQQQNTKKLYGPKNSCMQEQLGWIMNKKIQGDQETQLPLLKSPEWK